MRKKYNCDIEKEESKETCELNEDEKTTLTAAKDKEWKESVKTDKIRPNPIIVNVSLDDKYKGMTTGEKREVSKKMIDEDAKKDATVIKERVENAIGRNTPLSEELINAPEERSYNEKAWVNKDMKKPLGEVPENIKKVWEDDRKLKKYE